MPLALVGTSVSSADSVALPSGVQVGDIILVALDEGDRNWTLPAGYERAPSEAGYLATGSVLVWKIAGSSEPAFAMSTGRRKLIAVFRGNARGNAAAVLPAGTQGVGAASWAAKTHAVSVTRVGLSVSSEVAELTTYTHSGFSTVHVNASDLGFLGSSTAGTSPAITISNTPGGTSTYWAAVDVADNVAPNAATLTSPVGGSIDRTSALRFSWTFSDPDVGDSQSKYDLRYRIVGAASWTDVSGVTPNTFHDLSAGTLAAGDYEWQARTYDASGVVGPYSASSFFTAATPPDGPTITSPTNGQVLATASHTVTWSYPTQEAYQLRTVADNAGAADTAVVYTDTGIVESASARARSVAFATNDRFEHVQVRVRDTGLWSPWVSVRVQVSYTVPATPTLTVLASDSLAAIYVAISNPTPSGGQPSVASNDLLRRETATGGDGVRIATGLPPNSSTFDYTPASGTDYEYAVRAVGSNGTTALSAWTGGTSTTVPLEDFPGF